MIAPTEIIITRLNQRTWVFTDNVSNTVKFRSIYSGIGDEPNIGITDYRGATLYNPVNWQVYKYVDNTDPGATFEFESYLELISFLKGLTGFFYTGDTGEGGGSITDFFIVDAQDVNIPTLTGQAGKILAINPAGTAVIAIPNAGTQFRIANALDFTGPVQPLKYVTTNSTGTGFVLSDIEQIINTPIEVDEFRVVAKGTNDGVVNSEPFVKEVGDFCEGVYSLDGRYYKLVYNGGTDTENPLNNYEIRGWSEPLIT